MIWNTADDKKVLVLYLGDKQKVMTKPLYQKYKYEIMICTKESIKKSINHHNLYFCPQGQNDFL